LVVFISEEQTKENDENVGYLFLSGLQNFVIGNEVKTLFVIAELLSKTQGAISKASILRHCEEDRRSNPVIISYFRIASLRYQ
jgi:hypothetical protein